MTKAAKLRCAIYTRKSTEDGLDQAFNSLDAQREACAAFITSQSGVGWNELSEMYDDGGVSGGTMERPALARLLADIQAGKVDVIVVYKIDRLTRSLADFARMVELFEKHEVAFVSVTQQFNTTSSMGRLTLNVLLSFAQFEREVTAERIRDKIAASRRKGLWTGGTVPVGYTLRDHMLVPDKTCVRTVNLIFKRYLALGSVRLLVAELSAAPLPGLASPVARGRLYHMLANPVYVGKVRHKSNVYDGVHDAIIDKEVFDEAQSLLAKRPVVTSRTAPGDGLHLLTGLVYDETGDRLSPTHSSKGKRRFRYYISHRLMTKRKQPGDGKTWRIPAAELEQHAEAELKRLLNNHRLLTDMLSSTTTSAADPTQCELLVRRATKTQLGYSSAPLAERKGLLRAAFKRIDIERGMLRYTVDASSLVAHLLGTNETPADGKTAACEPTILERPFKLRRRGIESKIVIEGDAEPVREPDSALVGLLTRAHSYLKELVDGSGSTIASVANTNGVAPSEVSRILPLAFLAPSITSAILDGTQPADLTVDQLARLQNLPVDWQSQSNTILQ